MKRSLLWLVLQAVVRPAATLLFDLKAYGIGNVPAEGGALLLANHQSYLDPVLIAVKLRRPVSYMAKSELFRNKFLAWLITSLHAFPVNQTGFAKAAIDETIDQLNSGKLLNMYPEGTRTLDGEIAPIQRGIALILKKVTVPIIPVAIEGSFAAWPKGKKLFHAAPIRVMYGSPIDVTGLKGDQIVKKLDATLRELLQQLRAKIRDEKRCRQ